jgi:type II secretory pathway pseudopilin PulG
MIRKSFYNLGRFRGFTLVEVIVYFSILLVVSTASVGFLISLDRFVDQYKLETMLYRSGSEALEQIMLAIRQADQVNSLNTVEDVADGSLGVENTSDLTVFKYNAGDLELEINGQGYGDLTDDNVTVDGFTVYHYPMTDGEFVRVKLELTAILDDASVSKSITLYGGGVIRGAL